MQRVKRSTAVAALPVAPVGGTPGFFAAPNPAGGVPATVPGYEWFNNVQEELMAVIESTGRSPSDSDRTQLLQSIAAMIHGASRHIITPASRVANTLYTNSTNRIMTVTVLFQAVSSAFHAYSNGPNIPQVGDYISAAESAFGRRVTFQVLPGETYGWSYNIGYSVPTITSWVETY